MFIVMLIKHFQRIRGQKKPVSTLGAVWLLVLFLLAWIEFEIICFWGPACLAIYERWDDRRPRRPRRRNRTHRCDERETDVKR